MTNKNFIIDNRIQIIFSSTIPLMEKCLLFDCDDTLVDSEVLSSKAYVIMFAELGIELDLNTVLTRYRGWKLATILEFLSAEHNIKLTDDFVPNYRALVAKLFSSELKPIDGVNEALAQLPFPKAVVSSGPPEKIRHALSICNLDKHFGNNIYSSYDVGIWKPDPGIYQFAAKAMGFDYHDCIVIDDSLVGIEAGYKAGMKTFFYNRLNESCPYPFVTSFSSMSELPKLVATHS